MPGQPGLPNLTAMRGRRKGGAPTPQPRTLQGIAAHADAFLANLAARAYSQPSIEAHRWALRQFSAWTAGRGSDDPALFIRADLEKRRRFVGVLDRSEATCPEGARGRKAAPSQSYQLFLHHYRSPRGGKPLVTNTQLARLGCTCPS